ncbi:MAG: response regulator [Acidobacteria bacterium]|nr:response regulator [Acidobacteriota bacterium]
MREMITTLRTTQASRRVLVAEDDEVTMCLVTAILEKEGFVVVPARDGREAYKILHTDAAFEAAIFDMNMPHLRGLDLINQMRTEKRLMRIPVMMMTAEQDLKLRQNVFAAGAVLFLPKPFTPAQLQTTLRMLVSMAGTDKTRSVVVGRVG